MIIAIIIIVVVLLVLFGFSVRIVRQSTSVIVERLGKYHKTLDTGVHFILPIFDRTLPAISLKERVADFPPQPIITKDNVTMSIDTVVYFQITDPKLYSYGVEKPISAIENLTATTLRNIVGELELDETLTSRDTVNSKMRAILDDATDAWGIKINRVELKNIDPPQAIREAMEKQMRAERERREQILLAEGDKKSSILRAEGEKQAAILRAEAEKATLIAEAEGEAEAIRKIIEANPSKEYLTLKAYEALQKVADGQSTKLIVPSNIADMASLVSALTETVETGKEKPKK
ncbi:MAG: SPFH/Band 7/PHB domain protein [Clostridia bacterium]|nr:SPFH/Band 7/PHB domain protein [Clostridia bacterium]